MAAIAAREQKKVPLTFTSRILSQSSSVIPSRSVGRTNLVVAALLTRISNLPSVFTTFPTIDLTAASFEISARTAMAREPSCRISATVSSASPLEREKFTATSAPSRANRREVAFPIPVPPPVTRATFPSSLLIALVPPLEPIPSNPRDWCYLHCAFLKPHQDLSLDHSHSGISIMELKPPSTTR